MIKEYLHKKSFQFKEVRRGIRIEAIMNCPFCYDKEKKFAINLISGAFQCLHFNKCGEKGSFWKFQKKLGDKPMFDEKNIYNIKEKKYVKPNKENIKKIDDKAIEYLNSRKISKQTIEKFKIVSDKNNSAIAFPFFENQELINIKYRAINEKKFWAEKDAKHILFNLDHCIEDFLIVVEGEIDCLSMFEYGYNVVSVPSGASDLSWIENQFEKLQSYKRIYLSFDNDEAGQEAVKKIAKRLGEYRCYNIILPFKDVNECLMQGIEKEKISNCILNASDFQNKVIRDAGEFIVDLLNFNKNKLQLYGVRCLWSGLQEILKGWRMQEWSIWTGKNSSGKTTLLNQIIVDLINQEEKICMISLEMKPSRFLRWMIIQDLNKIEITDRDIEKTLIKFANYLYIIDIQGMIEQDQLLEYFEYCNKKFDCRHFFIDNLIGINMDRKYEYNEQKEFAKKINNFIQKNDCHLHLVAHPRKSQSDTDRADKVDISGTGDLTNLAYNVFSIYRNTEEEKEKALNKNINIADTILFIKKNREWGKEGKVEFKFDENSKRFIEIGDPIRNNIEQGIMEFNEN